MTTNGFWTAAPTHDPVRQFRFRVVIDDEFAWWAKTCDRPKINIPVLGKDEYYLGSSLPDVRPGEIADFQPITMTFIDPGLFGSSLLAKLKLASGECFPRIGGAELKRAFGNVVIEQVDDKGGATERWTLKGAFPTSIDFGSLDYGSSDFVEITITWEYTSFDFASADSVVLKSVDTRDGAPSDFSEAIALDGTFT